MEYSSLPWFLAYCWVALMVVLFLAVAYGMSNRKQDHEDIALKVVMVGIIFALLCFVPKWTYDFPHKDVAIVRNEDGKVVHLTSGAWDWQPHAVITFGDAQYSSEIWLTTSNPRIRRVCYTLSAKIVDRLKYLESIKDRLSDEKLPGSIVEYWADEFNEDCSPDIAPFYNPGDAKQQAEFKKLAGDWLRPKFEKLGMTVEISNFSLKD